jgi:hypothetical protein
MSDPLPQRAKRLRELAHYPLRKPLSCEDADKCEAAAKRGRRYKIDVERLVTRLAAGVSFELRRLLKSLVAWRDRARTDAPLRPEPRS